MCNCSDYRYLNDEHSKQTSHSHFFYSFCGVLCSYMSNMILKTRQVLNPPDNLPINQEPKRVLILHRDVGGPTTREPIRNIPGLVNRMRAAGYNNIHVVKSSNSKFWNCIPCQMEMYRNTWLFISSHGAGTMNLQFMPREGDDDLCLHFTCAEETQLITQGVVFFKCQRIVTTFIYKYIIY